ncbi:MAG: hypothetical protein ABR567_22445 [Myxococcales bacterium]|nr:hypothetical protein [Myxococcales bacterium]
MLSVVFLALVCIAEGIVFVIEYRNKQRGLLFWSSAAGLLFLVLLCIADVKTAHLEQVAERQQQWRRVTPEQHASLIESLHGESFEAWVSFVGIDPEATEFHADIQQALKDAGLKTKY